MRKGPRESIARNPNLKPLLKRSKAYLDNYDKIDWSDKENNNDETRRIREKSN